MVFRAASSFELNKVVTEALDTGRNPNLSRSEGEYVINPRGRRLHCKSFLANDKVESRGTVIFVHGYAAHSNRPLQTEVARQLNESGFGYVTLDLTGHGYSEGQKGLIDPPLSLVDDLLATLFAIYDDTSNDGTWGDASRLLGQQNSLRLRIGEGQCRDLYFIGHSMGGAVVTLAGLCLTSSLDGAWASDYAREHAARLAVLGRTFRGAFLLAPLISIRFPAVARGLLEALVCCCPTASLPRLVEGDTNDEHIWDSPVYRKYAKMDRWPENPRGLSYGGSMQLRSLLSLVSFSDLMVNSFAHVTFPFTILHDPQDAICIFGGSAKALHIARTKDKQKELIEAHSCLHDPLANDLNGSLKHILEWLSRQ